MAYPDQVARGTPAVVVVVPRHQRFGRAGRGVVSDLDWRPELHVPRAVAGIRRHGPVRARATDLAVAAPRRTASWRRRCGRLRWLSCSLWPSTVATSMPASAF